MLRCVLPMIMSLQTALHHAVCLVCMGHSIQQCQRIAPYISLWV